MKLFLLDTDFTAIAVIDTFTEFIWTDRYWECGDFDIELSAADPILKEMKMDRYLYYSESDRLMVIEILEYRSDYDKGSYAVVKGRSLESILDRRIVWGLKNFDTTVYSAIQTLINENYINPSDANRKITDMEFVASEDSAVTTPRLEAQYTGDNIYNIISDVCKENKLGFKLIRNDSGKIQFSLYSGVDRSYGQTANSYVIFSPYFENIVNTTYTEDKTEVRNTVLIGGEGEGSSRKYATIAGTETGIARRELFVDARGVSSNVNGSTISNTKYQNLLIQKGNDKLKEYKLDTEFDCEAAVTNTFKMGIDFNVGDIVNVQDEYGHNRISRIIEIIHSYNDEGYKFYPTFETIDEE